MALNVVAIIWTAAAFILSLLLMTVIYKLSKRSVEIANAFDESWDGVEQRIELFSRAWRIVRVTFFVLWLITVVILLLAGTYIR